MIRLDGDHVPLRDALQQLADQTGITVYMDRNEHALVTIHTRASTLGPVLRRLLRGRSYALSYGDDGRRELWMVDSAVVDPARVAIVAPSSGSTGGARASVAGSSAGTATGRPADRVGGGPMSAAGAAGRVEGMGWRGSVGDRAAVNAMTRRRVLRAAIKRERARLAMARHRGGSEVHALIRRKTELLRRMTAAQSPRVRHALLKRVATVDRQLNRKRQSNALRMMKAQTRLKRLKVAWVRQSTPEMRVRQWKGRRMRQRSLMRYQRP